MSNYCIRQTRVHDLKLPTGYDPSKILIGIPVSANEDDKLGFKNIGDCVLPPADFGPACKKNAYGYSYPDKTLPKKRRVVSTFWYYPYGNVHASLAWRDIVRDCYQRVDVPPTEIEFELIINSEDGKKYIVAVLTPDVRNQHLKEVVNLFLEIYGFCYIYSETLESVPTNRRRCNWEILPPGENPSKHIKQQLRRQGKNEMSFDVARLEHLENYSPELVVEGINGFAGYYAYLFSNMCVLETVLYGNATYIIPKENWERLSQKTKSELIDSEQVLYRIIHTKSWLVEIDKIINKI